MPSYRYTGTDPKGEKLTGTVAAESKSEAEADISKVHGDLSDIDIEELPEENEKSERPEILNNSLGTFREKISWEKLTDKLRGVSFGALSKVCRQVSISLKSGQSAAEALSLAAEHTGDRKLASLLRQVSAGVAGGMTLRRSIEERGKLLPEAFRECVRAGETSGDLAGAFERLEGYCAGMGGAGQRIAYALIYPVLLIAAAIIVMNVVTGKALPALTAALVSLGAELPWGTRAVLGVSGFLGKFGAVLLLLIILAVIGLCVWSGTEEGGQRLARFRLRLPVVGNIAKMSGAARFAGTMSLMLASGLSKAEAMDIAGHAVANKAMASEIQEAVHDVMAGRSLGGSLAGSETLPEQLVSIAASGEKDGTLEESLRSLAEYFSAEAEESTGKALSVLEAAVIAVVALTVILVLIGVYLPILGMYAPA